MRTFPEWEEISIHPPRAGWDMEQREQDAFLGISIHPPRAGWDGNIDAYKVWRDDFNPPTPCGVGLGEFCGKIFVIVISIHPPRAGWDQHRSDRLFRINGFQSTHPVRGGTCACTPLKPCSRISIHPPRAGWDLVVTPYPAAINYFNPPTPCGVGPPISSRAVNACIFQSTHPVRGGTSNKWSKRRTKQISIHPPRAGWDFRDDSGAQRLRISIHPPRAGWDEKIDEMSRYLADFNPPTPCGVGPPQSDVTADPKKFQSTHPVRGGTETLVKGISGNVFQSTHPVRGGTGWRAKDAGALFISIHPPRAGWDPFARWLHGWPTYFNPPTPCGVGRNKGKCKGIDMEFQSTHPVRGGTAKIHKISFVISAQ